MTTFTSITELLILIHFLKSPGQIGASRPAVRAAGSEQVKSTTHQPPPRQFLRVDSTTLSTTPLHYFLCCFPRDRPIILHCRITIKSPAKVDDASYSPVKSKWTMKPFPLLDRLIQWPFGRTFKDDGQHFSSSYRQQRKRPSI